MTLDPHDVFRDANKTAREERERNNAIFNVIENIINSLIENEDKFFARGMDQLIRKNGLINNKPNIQGMLHRGTIYRKSDIEASVYTIEKFESDISLHAEIDEIIRSHNNVTHDADKIRQGLFMLLEPARNYQDVRDALPESIVIVIQGELGDFLRKLPRTQNERFTLINPQTTGRRLEQYEKIESLLLSYMVRKMII